MIRAVDQLNSLRQKPKAVAMLWVDWSMAARASEITVDAIVANRDPSCVRCPFVKIDVSEQSGELWDMACNWISSSAAQNPSGLIYGGAGSLLFLRHGRIVDHCLNAGEAPMNHLLGKFDNIYADGFDIAT